MRLIAPAALLLSLFLAASAGAAPVRYDFDSGFVTITASVGGTQIGGPVTADLDGIQVTVDESALDLVSVALSAPGPIDLSFAPAYLGYTDMTIESLSLSGTSGLLVPVQTLPSVQEYFFLVDPLLINAVVSATGTSPPLVSLPISGQAPGSGGVLVASDLNQLSLSGITIGAFAPVGMSTTPLVLKADFVFSGSPIPEPSAALLFASGFAALASRRSRLGSPART